MRALIRILISGSTLLVAAAIASAGPHDQDRTAILQVLSEYRAAMSARSVDLLSRTVSPELSVAEGTLVNRGWADYRDHHIGPEMKDWVSFHVTGLKTVSLEVAGDEAFVLQSSMVTISESKETVALDAVETFVLRRSAGGWKIRHIHFSGKRRP